MRLKSVKCLRGVFVLLPLATILMIGCSSDNVSVVSPHDEVNASVQAWKFHRFWNQSRGDHLYKTGDYTPPGYESEGFEGYVYAQQVDGTTPLYWYKLDNGTHLDNFYTITDCGDYIGGVNGWKKQNLRWYVFEHDIINSDRKPLYRYWNPYCCDHFYTTTWMGGSIAGGWQMERVECYVKKGP